MSNTISTTGIQGVSKSLNSVMEKYSKLTQKSSEFSSKTSYAFVSAAGDMHIFSKEINKTSSEFEKIQKKSKKTSGVFQSIEKQTKKTSGGLKSMVGSISKGLNIGSPMAMAKSLFTMGANAENATAKFNVLLGNSSDASNMMAELSDYASKTPYDNMGLQKAAQDMLELGVSQEKLMPNLKMLGDVAMGSKEKFSSLSTTFAGIMNAGKLGASDLESLRENGFRPLEIMASQTGLSMDELNKKMEAGAISSDMVEGALSAATSSGGEYFNAAEDLGDTSANKILNIIDLLQTHIGKASEALLEMFRPIIDFVYDLAVTWLPKLSEFITTYEPLIYGIVGALAAYQLITTIITVVTEGWAFATGILNAIMDANPIGIVILAIVTLVGLVIYAWKKFDWFRGAVSALWEMLKGLATMIKDLVISRFKDLLNGVMGIGKALWALFNRDFDGAFEYGKKALRSLVGVDTVKKFAEDGKKLGGAVVNAYKAELDETKGEVPSTNADSSTSYGSVNDLPAPLGNGGQSKQANTPPYYQGKYDFLQNQTPSFVPNQMMSFNKNDKTTPNSLIHDSNKDSLTNNNANKKIPVSGGARVTQGAQKINSGGKKQTNITININKLQDKTEIHVSNVEKGINRLGERIQEELLRAVNSVNQIQTA